MNADAIMMIDDLRKRFEMLLDRWLELDEMTGNRTLQEIDEMGQIADAVMNKLIHDHRVIFGNPLAARPMGVLHGPAH